MAILCKQFSIEYREDGKKHRSPEDHKMYDGYSDITLTFKPSTNFPATEDGFIAYDIYSYERKIIYHVHDYMKDSGYNKTSIGEETKFFGTIYFTHKELKELMSTPTHDKFIELINKEADHE